MDLKQLAEDERLDILAARAHALRADLEAINGLIAQASQRFADLEFTIRKPPQIERLLERKAQAI